MLHRTKSLGFDGAVQHFRDNPVGALPCVAPISPSSLTCSTWNIQGADGQPPTAGWQATTLVRHWARALTHQSCCTAAMASDAALHHEVAMPLVCGISAARPFRWTTPPGGAIALAAARA